MRWEGRRESSNVEDRRRLSGGRMAIGGGMGTLILMLIVYFLGGDPSALLNPGGGGPLGGVETTGTVDPEQDEQARFIRVVLADTEDVWNEQFRRAGKQYREPQLVLFNGTVQSACGHASAASGPFYCPADRKAYIDLSFFKQLKQRFRAPGDFAQAYVLAHEIGHHVQNLLGISDRVHEARGRVSEEEYNRLSVRLELQADFLAGVWAHHTQKVKNVLEAGDVEEALGAASAIGDDRIQMQSQGYVVPESFTHGSAQQRVRWFKKGLATGDLSQGDTFSLPDP